MYYKLKWLGLVKREKWKRLWWSLEHYKGGKVHWKKQTLQFVEDLIGYEIQYVCNDQDTWAIIYGSISFIISILDIYIQK